MDAEHPFLVGGVERVTITVVPYDATWPVRYDALAAAVRSALGGRVLALEHIGSTSVPGLVAKPIVDVLLVVADVADEAAYVPALAPLGLALRVREPTHRMLRTAVRDVHLHVLSPGDRAIDDYLHLRQVLRSSAEARERYGSLKLALAQQEWEDMNAYADAKTDVIQELLDETDISEPG